jgi:hypothetical protein
MSCFQEALLRARAASVRLGHILRSQVSVGSVAYGLGLGTTIVLQQQQQLSCGRILWHAGFAKYQKHNYARVRSKTNDIEEIVISEIGNVI